MITLLGPTASGKTNLAVHLAKEINGEIISADSRQVYQGMDIGTGKDLKEYEINGQKIPYHLIDILPAGAEYNVFRFQEDFLKIHQQIASEKIILCGGTGMYIESILKGYRLLEVPIDKMFHKKAMEISTEELSIQLQNIKKAHNTTDTSDKKRLIRALEIALYEQKHQDKINSFPTIQNTTFGISIERNILKERITKRLHDRLQEGMIEEVEKLLTNGVTTEKLYYYGLEYKFISQFLLNELSYDEMIKKLNIGIHQFSKKQMTWFRRMEKQGMKIHWLNGNLSIQEKIAEIMTTLKK